VDAVEVKRSTVKYVSFPQTQGLKGALDLATPTQMRRKLTSSAGHFEDIPNPAHAKKAVS
jgi:hypothetical protein